MSLHSFQSALAYALRAFDEHKPKTLSELGLLYDLTVQEKATLENIIQQQMLKSYSEELFLARWTIIRDALEFLQPFVDFWGLRELFIKYFDQKNYHVIQEDLALRFLDYLIEDPLAYKFISTDTPEFFPSLVRYTQGIFTFKHNCLPVYPLPHNSLLTERYFRIIELDYDVREFFAELIELNDRSKISIKFPVKRKILLLFVASEEVTEFRSFEIDHELNHFLVGQLKGDMPSMPPSCYEDLVELGLCKGLKKKQQCCDKHH